MQLWAGKVKYWCVLEYPEMCFKPYNKTVITKQFSLIDLLYACQKLVEFFDNWPCFWDPIHICILYQIL